MGHEVRYYTYDENVNQRKVQDELDAYVRKACWEEGSSGLFSPIHWVDRVFSNREAAENYIEGRNGYYDQVAVKFQVHEKMAPTKAILTLKERLEKERAKKVEYAKAHSVSSFKADYVGCPECGSKLKRALLKGESCPLCRAELRSKTTVDTLTRYENNILDLQKQIKEAERKAAEKAHKVKVMWLVKIEFHT